MAGAAASVAADGHVIQMSAEEARAAARMVGCCRPTPRVVAVLGAALEAAADATLDTRSRTMASTADVWASTVICDENRSH